MISLCGLHQKAKFFENTCAVHEMMVKEVSELDTFRRFMAYLFFVNPIGNSIEDSVAAIRSDLDSSRDLAGRFQSIEILCRNDV